jgi:tripartite ATP-independent transporter DctP family solute receptor
MHLARRAALSRLIPALALCAAAALPAAAADKVMLRIGHFDPDRDRFGTGTFEFCKSIARRTLAGYGCDELGETMGTPAEQIDALRQGKLDVVNLTIEPLQAAVPELRVFAVPFLFRDADHARRALDGAVGKALQDKLQAAGLVALAWTELGMRQMTTRTAPVTTAADLKGLRLRTDDHAPTVAGFKALQAIVEPMPFPLVYDALAQGRLDGQENLLQVIADANYSRVQGHLSLTDHVYAPGLMLVSSAFWARLPAADRDKFIAAAKSAAATQRRRAARDDAQVVSILQRNGMKVVRKVDRASFERALEGFYAEAAKAPGGELIAPIRALK